MSADETAAQRAARDCLSASIDEVENAPVSRSGRRSQGHAALLN
jgi:hypothetical protein